ncbi:MAG: choice-of-anchor D domain-containing protein [Betaproteobacteria bacterium]|nr:choice-of-anchor D domain-containing protein [Betaproteobacteria bacterium]
MMKFLASMAATAARGIVAALLALACGLGAGGAFAQNAAPKISAESRAAIEAALNRGEAQDLLVTYDAAAIRAQAKLMRIERRLPRNDDEILRVKALGYAETKAAVAASLGAARPLVLKPYGQLPVEFVRVGSAESLAALLADPRVTGVALPEAHTRMLQQSLPLINQPGAAQQGNLGVGTAVAVLDTGVDYTRTAFGACAAPGPGCKVVYAQDFAPEDGLRDEDGHGTNVAGIVLGVAPEARIIALDVFRSDGFAYSQDIIAAINWSIQQKSQYNIAAINLSLGSGRFASPISSPRNAYKRAIDDARDAGIVVVAASGNDAYTDALASPAAVDTAVSVGAVYDSAMGAINWSKCSDAVTAADQVTCFSNSASFLTALGPGARISAAGEQMGGTSQAAPHVAGAVAVLQSAYPSESVNQIISRLAAGVPVTDPRNLLVKPRVDLAQALGLDLVPDAFLFQDETSAAPGVQVTSNPVTITGLVGWSPVSISSPGEYSVNGGAFVTGARTVANGDVVRVRLVSSTTPGAVASATLTVGGVSDTFSVTTSASATAPSVQLAPGTLAFGGVEVGTSAVQTVTLGNAGNATLDGVSLSVTPGQDFSIASSDCGATLAPGQSCAIAVAFAPSAAVSRNATLGVSSNASGSPHTVPLSGTGVVVVSLAEAVDNPALAFASGGNAAWFGQTGVSVSGGDAARSGLLDHLQSAYLETTVTGPGTVSFQWKVSSEPNFDVLRFYIDGVEFASISGEVDWTAKTYSPGAGSHALRWTYSKDGSISSGSDAGWVDAVTFTPGEASVSLSASSLDFGGVVVGSTASQTLTVTNTGSAPLAIAAVTVAGLGFSKAADSCSGASVAPAATCSATLEFGPTALGIATGSLTLSSNAPGSPHVATMTGSGTASTTLGVALDNASLSFATGEAAPWFAQTAVTRVAGDSTAQTGATGDFQVSYLETIVTGPGRLRFFWKVSSEPAYDRLALLLDGTVQGWISGEFDWEERFYDIGAGVHVVRWTYIRTAEEPGGANAGWVDQVAFEPLAAPVNLAEALEAPSFAWRTIGIEGSSAPWIGQGAISISGGDAAESPIIADGQSSELRAIVTGPGTLSFNWKVSSEAGFDLLCFYPDYSGTAQDCISGEVDWTLKTVSIAPGVWPLSWIYSKDESIAAGSDRGWVDLVSFTPTAVPLGEAADNATLSFETNPSAPWYGQTPHAAMGGDAVQSAPIEDGQRTWLQATVTGPGTLSFYWKVSSEPGYDTLRFYVDGTEVPAIPAISGEVDWTRRSVFIGSGAHVVTWAYWKDFYCCAAGLDSAWVDGVAFAPSSADTQAPGVPPGLSASAVGPSQIDLSWSPSIDNVGVTAYRIHRDGIQIATVPGSTHGYSDTELAASTLYGYTVIACDAAGNCSAPSAPVSATTLAPPDTLAPSVPTGLSATAVSASRIDLAWNAATDNTGVTSYRLYRGGALFVEVSGSTLFHSDTGLSAATTYTYTVSACDLAGNCSAQSASASATTPSPVPVFAPSLERGWNLLGNALNFTLDVATLFGNHDAPTALTDSIVSVWKWNAGGPRWAFYSPQLSLAEIAAHAASRNYDVLTTINPGEGYWVNAIGAVSLPTQSGTAFKWNSFSFAALPPGFNLISHATELTPSQFNIGVNPAPPSPGVVPTGNFLSLWAWDAVAGAWYFYSPLLEATGGLPAVKAYADSHFFRHFQDYDKTIDIGVGFWVNRP